MWIEMLLWEVSQSNHVGESLNKSKTLKLENSVAKMSDQNQIHLDDLRLFSSSGRNEGTLIQLPNIKSSLHLRAVGPNRQSREGK